MSMTSFLSGARYPALARAVIRQSGGWENFTSMARDLQHGGIDGGFRGFIYTAETTAFAKRNRASIQEIAREQADDLGLGIIEMVQGFSCFRHDKPSEHEVATALYGGKPTEGTDNVLNALAWYAGEEIAREYMDGRVSRPKQLTQRSPYDNP